MDQATLDQAGRLRSRLLSRAHGKAGNIWREGLIEMAHQRGGTPLSKRDARVLVDASSHQPVILDTRLIDLPRHQIARLLADVTACA